MLELLRKRKALAGMVHVQALPGTPRAAMPLPAIIEHAVSEARLYEAAGLDAIMIENMHDVPYMYDAVGPEIVAGMTAVGAAVRAAVRLPLGVQILAAANREALAVAHAVSADFVRVENFAFAHVADEGLMSRADAGPLLRYRRQIGAERIAIFADVKKKHAAHALTGDISLADAAKVSVWCGADGVIITGGMTGEPATVEDVARAQEAVMAPVFVGSGVTAENLGSFWPHADAFIVGSFFKCGGRWAGPIDSDRVRRFMDAAALLRRKHEG